MIRPGIENPTLAQAEIAELVVVTAAHLIAQNPRIFLIGYDGYSSDVLFKQAEKLSGSVVDRINDGTHIQEVEALQGQYKAIDTEFGRRPRVWENKEPDFVCSRLGRKALKFALAKVNTQRFYNRSNSTRSS